MSNLTQEEKILQELKRSGNIGLHPSTLVLSLKILQYNARINGLRQRFGCQCKNGNELCFATEHIRNYDLPDGTTLFKYHVDNSRNWENMRRDAIAKQNEHKQVGLF